MKIMNSLILLILFAGVLVGMPDTANCGVWVDSERITSLPNYPETSSADYLNGVDVVGGTTSSSSATGRAKGGSYQIDTAVVLEEMEFWLNFSDTQTLTSYVFESPVEFGTYTEIYRNSETVTGSGTGWYSSGPVSVTLYEGTHYIIIVSWDGTVGYFWNTGNSQNTSFGAYTHGYAIGYDPLPSSFSSTGNDQAIYHQRLTTTPVTSLQRSTWGSIKSLN